MAIEYNFTLDMDRSKRDNNIAYARTGDVDSITINADLVLNGTAYTPTGTNAFFECVTPNGHSIRAAAEKTGSTVSVDVPSAAFQAAGVINVAYFRFESGEADNPTYVESTEPFAIVVREGIGDNIDAGDYIEEWRGLADQLEAAVAEVEKNAEQAKTAINEQKTEVDTLKSQAQQQIAQDVVDVESAATTAKSSISTQVDGVETAAETAKGEINDKVAGIQSQIDTVVSDAKQEVDENIAELDKATQDAIDAMNEALSGEQVQQLKDAISRHWALDAQDMGEISSGNDMDTFTAAKSYVCKTDEIAKLLVNKPEDLACSFIMHVMSIDSSSDNLVQLIIPQMYDDTKSSVSFYIRKRVSAGTFTDWKKVGADIVAGTGIKIEDDVVSVDPDSFHQSYEDVSLASSDTSVTGGASIEELVVKGNTRQNLWMNPNGTKNGVTATSNEDGSITLSGIATAQTLLSTGNIYALKPNTQYTFSVDKTVEFESRYGFAVDMMVGSEVKLGRYLTDNNSITFTTPSDMTHAIFRVSVNDGQTASGTYHVMLNEGSEAEPWCPPGLNGVDELSVVTAGKNLAHGELYNYGTDNVRQDGDGGGIYLAAGTYTISADIEGLTPSQISVGTNYDKLITDYAYNTNELTFTLDNAQNCFIDFYHVGGIDVSQVNNVQLELGSTATAYEPPAVTSTPIDLDGHALNALPDGTRDELRIDGTGAVTLVQMVGVALYDGTSEAEVAPNGESHRVNTNCENDGASDGDFSDQMCDKLSVFVYGNNKPCALMAPDADIGISVYTVADPGDVDFVEGLAPIKMLYALAALQEIDLGHVELPSVKSDKANVWIISNKVSEEVKFDISLNKVDYREIDAPSADDAYSKSEVDSLLEAKEDAFDVLPVSSGGTGVTTAAAERNRLGLGNTTGAVPIANGGTGVTTAKAAQYSLFKDMNNDTSVPADTSMLVFANTTPSATSGAVYKRSISKVWDWIVTKIRSTFGFSSANVLQIANGGTGSSTPEGAREAIGAGTSDFSGSYNDLIDKPSIPSVPISVADGGTGATIAADARTNLDVYSKSETDGKIPKVVYGKGNIPDDAEPGTIYINYSE